MAKNTQLDQAAYGIAGAVPSNQARSQSLALIALCMAQFMLVLDIAIVNVGLPSIQADLAFPPGNLQLVVTAYSLTFGGLLLLGGRITDLLGKRLIFMIGLTLFTLASLACGIAQSATMMIIARAVQGIGGALVSPAALSLLITLYPEGKARNQALGVWSALAASGGAAGLLLGGVLTSLASWRWVFLVTVPLGIIVVLASFWVLPQSRPTSRGRIDIAGAVTITAGLIALVYGLSRGGQVGFSNGLVIALLIASVILLASFVVIEQRVQQPLVPFTLFRLRTLSGANLATLLLSAVIVGANYFLTLYFQLVLGYTPIITGLAFLSMTVASALASAIASRLVNRFSVRLLLLVGMLALAAGGALLSQISPHGTYVVDVLPGMLLVAVGLGIGFTVGTLAATAGVEAKQQGVASGVLSTSQQIGGALGLAILTTVAGAVTASATGSTAQTLTSGFRAAFLVTAVFGLAAALVVWLLVREDDCQKEIERRSQAASPIAVPTSGHAPMSPCEPAVIHLAAQPQAGAGTTK